MKIVRQLFLVFAALFAAAYAPASTITFSPVSQTVTLGGNATVDVQISGLTRSQALGAFDLTILNNAAIIRPISISYFSSLGDPGLQLTDSVLTNSSANASEVSFESSAALLALQSSQPFSLFRLNYLAVGLGTSQLTLGGSPLVLSDQSGALLPIPSYQAGSITVVDGMMTPVPEPSTLALLTSGLGATFAMVKRRRING